MSFKLAADLKALARAIDEIRARLTELDARQACPCRTPADGDPQAEESVPVAPKRRGRPPRKELMIDG